MSKIEPTLRWLDNFNVQISKYIAYLTIIPLTFITTFEVFMRYVVRRPTIWAWDVNVQLLGFMVMGCAAYNIVIGSHIKVDVIVNRLKERTRRIIDLITSGLFFFAFGILVWLAVKTAWDATLKFEKYGGLWEPPIWPFRIMLALGIILMLLQGIAKFIRDLDYVIHPERGTATSPSLESPATDKGGIK